MDGIAKLDDGAIHVLQYNSVSVSSFFCFDDDLSLDSSIQSLVAWALYYIDLVHSIFHCRLFMTRLPFMYLMPHVAENKPIKFSGWASIKLGLLVVFCMLHRLGLQLNALSSVFFQYWFIFVTIMWLAVLWPKLSIHLFESDNYGP